MTSQSMPRSRALPLSVRRGKPPDTAPQEGTTSQADEDQITRLRSALAAQTARADELAAALSAIKQQERRPDSHATSAVALVADGMERDLYTVEAGLLRPAIPSTVRGGWGRVYSRLDRQDSQLNLRLGAIFLTEARSFEFCALATIIVNCVTMVMSAPSSITS